VLGFPTGRAGTAAAQRQGTGQVPADWLRLAGTARMLSWLTLAWMGIEGGVAIGAAVIAGSVALLGFGLDSGIEAMASVIVIWRFTGTRLASATSERRAQQLVAVSFFLLAPYIAADAIRALVAGDRAETSIAGLVLTAGTAIVEPALGVASALGSDHRPPPEREPRTCCAPTWRSRCSPGWPPTPCGASGGSTAWSRWASQAGRSWKGGGSGPDGRTAAHASQGPNAESPAPGLLLPLRRFIDYRRLTMKEDDQPLDRVTATEYATWFKALADPTRIQIVSLLARRAAPMNVGEIVAAVSVGQSTVSAHLKVLAEVRFVLAEPRGTATYYRINDACVDCFPTAADIVMGRPVPDQPPRPRSTLLRSS
jgi:DNA-binding transcriptional ArsR family regulator